MKKVLIISYYFPPDGAVGGLRILGLAKYLSRYGWEPTIVIPNDHGRSKSNYKIVNSPYFDFRYKIKTSLGLISKTPSSKRKININKNFYKSYAYMFLFKLSEIFEYPDPQIGWAPHALKTCENLLKDNSFDAIISSSKPETCHIVASKLKNKFDLPWVADFRDLWTLNHYYSYSNYRKMREQKLEKRILRNADMLVTVSNILANQLKELHNKRTNAIPNGYDPEILNKGVSLSDKFTISYTGDLYHGKRDPSYLIKSISDLIKERKFNRNIIELCFYGPDEDWLVNEARKYEIEDVVHIFGHVPRDVAILKQRESQLLLILLWNHPAEKGVYTGKIFEYLAAQRPILAIGGPNESVIKQLLQETNAGYYLNTIPEIKSCLEKFYTKFLNEKSIKYCGDQSKIEGYSQIKMAERFANILNNI